MSKGSPTVRVQLYGPTSISICPFGDTEVGNGITEGLVVVPLVRSPAIEDEETELRLVSSVDILLTIVLVVDA